MNQQHAQAYGAFILRVAFGVMLLAHAALKIFVFTVPGTVGFFASLGLPAAAAYLVIAGESLGGIAMLIGFRTRLVALATLPILLGAVWAHAGNGWVFSNANGGWEYPVFLAVIAVVQSLLGSGAFALGDAFAAEQTNRRLARA